MRRSRVLLPEPDWPSRATTSPSRRVKSTLSSTVRVCPSAERNILDTDCSSITGALMVRSSEVQTFAGLPVQPAPEEVVEAHHEDAHHRDAQRDAREVAHG